MGIAVNAGEAVASRFVAGIEASFIPVRDFPLAAPARDQLAPGLRVIFHSSYAVYYKPLGDAVVIVRVLYHARDVAAIAAKGGFAE